MGLGRTSVWVGSWLMVVTALTSHGAGAEPAPIHLKGVVDARGTMGLIHYKVEGTGPLLPGSPQFHLTTSVPITQLASAKPVVTLESPRGQITIQVTQEVSIKDKTIVPFRITGGTRAYAHASGTGRIKLELVERSGLNGTVRLRFLLPEPQPQPGAMPQTRAEPTPPPVRTIGPGAIPADS